MSEGPGIPIQQHRTMDGKPLDDVGNAAMAVEKARLADAEAKINPKENAGVNVGDTLAGDFAGLKFVAVPLEMVDGVSRIVRELDRAMKKFPNNSTFRSRHEGYGVTMEEVEEWWQAIMKNDHGFGKGQDCAEAVQCGAMFLHYLKDFGK